MLADRRRCHRLHAGIGASASGDQSLDVEQPKPMLRAELTPVLTQKDDCRTWQAKTVILHDRIFIDYLLHWGAHLATLFRL